MSGWQCCSTTTQASMDYRYLDYTAIMPCSGRSGKIWVQKCILSLLQNHIYVRYVNLASTLKRGCTLAVLICLFLSSTAFWPWSLLNVLHKHFTTYFSLILWLVSLMTSLPTCCKIHLRMQHFSSVKTEEWLIATYLFWHNLRHNHKTRPRTIKCIYHDDTALKKERNKNTWIPH